MERAFLFAGQGSQYVGMGKDLYEKYRIAKEYFDKADAIVNNLKRVCFEGPEDELKLTKYTQPGIYTVSAIISKILSDEKNIHPDVVAGFSLGEYSALYAAGCFDFETGLKLVKVRGEAMTEAGEKNPGTMAAVIGLEDKIVEEVCKEITAKGEVVVPVNYNCPEQLVISGTVKGVEEAVKILEEKDAKRAVILNVSGAFHSPLMKLAEEKLKEALENIEIQKPSVPIIMNASAEIEEAPDEIKSLMIKQMASAVLWKHSMEKLIGNGVKQFYELGPGRVLTGFMRRISREVTVTSIQNLNDLESI